MFCERLNGKCRVKKVLIMLLAGGLVVGLSLPALAVKSVEFHKLTASDADAEDQFGYSVAISGSTALDLD